MTELSANSMSAGHAAERCERSHAAPINVLFVDHTAQLGGGEVALLRLITNLDPRRYRPVVVLFSTGPLVKQISDAGIDVHILPLSETISQARKDTLGIHTLLRFMDLGRLIRHIARLARLIAMLDARIVHCNSLKADIIGAIAGRLMRRKVIWHIRDHIAPDYLPPMVVRVFRNLCRILPHYVIANSASTLSTIGSRRLASAIPSGVSVSAATQVVHDGWVEAPLSIAAKAECSQCRRVGIVGRLARWKGQHVFIEAVALALQHGLTNVRFFIVGSALFGESDYEAELKALVAEKKLNGFIEFLGFRSDVQAVIAGLDLLVHASVSPEPFGQVIIEGMAAGKPVIATRGGGVTEIIDDGSTGKLVPMDNATAMAGAICELLANPEAAAKMGQKARRRIFEDFTIESTSLKVQQVYDVLTSSP